MEVGIMKKWLPTAIVGSVVLLFGVFFMPRDNSDVIDDVVGTFKNTIAMFEEMNIETNITIDEEVIYVEDLTITKTDDGSSYTSTVTELSDSLLDDELYTTTTSTGNLDVDETIGLLGAVAALDKDVITNVELLPIGTDSYAARFTILNKHIDQAFGQGMADKISGNIKFEAIMVEGIVERYTYTYTYNDGSITTVIGTFVK